MNRSRPEIYSNCSDNQQELTFLRLAEILAPVFWFSPDEPLLVRASYEAPSTAPSGRAPIPHELPPPGLDVAVPNQSVVYYRLVHARLRRGSAELNRKDLHAIARGPGVSHRDVPLDRFSELTLRYFSYYYSDIGSTGHLHDVEVVDVVVRIDRVWRPRDPCFGIRIARIVGAAHGADWYSNVLDLEKGRAYDIILPPHVLVEEGKHASAPDRNADGWFTPGYDVTRQVNDAWGVRDALRNVTVAARSYDVSHAKDRCSDPRMAVLWERRQEILLNLDILEASRSEPRHEQLTSRCLLQFDSAQRKRMLRPYRLEEAGYGDSGAVL